MTLRPTKSSGEITGFQYRASLSRSGRLHINLCEKIIKEPVPLISKLFISALNPSPPKTHIRKQKKKSQHPRCHTAAHWQYTPTHTPPQRRRSSKQQTLHQRKGADDSTSRRRNCLKLSLDVQPSVSLEECPRRGAAAVRVVHD